MSWPRRLPLVLCLAVGLGCSSRLPEYRVLKSGGDRAKDNWHVELASKADESALMEIAQRLRREKGSGASRAYVWFHLPGNPTSNAWVMASIDDDPGVEINGLTAEQEAALIASAPRHDETIGRWVEDDLSRQLLTIYRESGRLYLAAYGGRSELKDELVPDGPAGKQRFRRREFSPAGDHYVINDRGDLEVRDSHGLNAYAHRAIESSVNP